MGININQIQSNFCLSLFIYIWIKSKNHHVGKAVLNNMKDSSNPAHILCYKSQCFTTHTLYCNHHMKWSVVVQVNNIIKNSYICVFLINSIHIKPPPNIPPALCFIVFFSLINLIFWLNFSIVLILMRNSHSFHLKAYKNVYSQGLLENWEVQVEKVK
jgi:hypothetical protein